LITSIVKFMFSEKIPRVDLMTNSNQLFQNHYLQLRLIDCGTLRKCKQIYKYGNIFKKTFFEIFKKN
jgi:hypothetical protein